MFLIQMALLLFTDGSPVPRHDSSHSQGIPSLAWLRAIQFRLRINPDLARFVQCIELMEMTFISCNFLRTRVRYCDLNEFSWFIMRHVKSSC